MHSRDIMKIKAIRPNDPHDWVCLKRMRNKVNAEIKQAKELGPVFLEVGVIAEILEVANNPNLNKNRGSTVRGDRWFELHVIEYQSRFNDRSLEFITIVVVYNKSM